MAASCSAVYRPLSRSASNSDSGAFGSIARLVAGVRWESRCVTVLATPAPRDRTAGAVSRFYLSIRLRVVEKIHRRDPPGRRTLSPEPQTDWNPAAFRTMI